MATSTSVRLDRDECLRLLQFEAFLGRVGFLAGERLEILPVNYLADADRLFFCSAAGAKLSSLTAGANVVFEVDQSHALGHEGWSVIVRGRAFEVTESAELDALRRGPLKSWAVASSEHWIRVEIEEVSGVRIPAH